MRDGEDRELGRKSVGERAWKKECGRLRELPRLRKKKEIHFLINKFPFAAYCIRNAAASYHAVATMKTLTGIKETFAI